MAGNFNTMRRNFRTFSDNILSNHDKLDTLKGMMSTFLSNQELMLTRLDKISFSIHMNTEDITIYFPADTDQQILDFMSNADFKFKLRKLEFEKLLFTTISEKMTQRKFSDSLMATLFTRSYMLTHKWPQLR